MKDPHVLEAVQELQLRYVSALDDGELERWPELFTDPCLYRVTHHEDFAAGRGLGMIYAESRAMLADRVSSLLRVNVYEAQRYRHVINPPRLSGPDGAADGARVTAHTGFIVARIMRTGETTLFATGCYLDRIDLSGPEPRFAEKVVVLDSPVIDTLLALPL